MNNVIGINTNQKLSSTEEPKSSPKTSKAEKLVNKFIENLHDKLSAKGNVEQQSLKKIFTLNPSEDLLRRLTGTILEERSSAGRNEDQVKLLKLQPILKTLYAKEPSLEELDVAPAPVSTSTLPDEPMQSPTIIKQERSVSFKEPASSLEIHSISIPEKLQEIFKNGCENPKLTSRLLKTLKNTPENKIFLFDLLMKSLNNTIPEEFQLQIATKLLEMNPDIHMLESLAYNSLRLNDEFENINALIVNNLIEKGAGESVLSLLLKDLYHPTLKNLKHPFIAVIIAEGLIGKLLQTENNADGKATSLKILSEQLKNISDTMTIWESETPSKILKVHSKILDLFLDAILTKSPSLAYLNRIKDYFNTDSSNYEKIQAHIIERNL